MKVFYNKKISFLLLVLVCITIFYLSNQDGHKSSEISNNLFIRKVGHFSEYFVLGILSFNFFSEVVKEKNKKYFIKVFLISFFFCVLYAISDEVHQTFIPFRSGNVKDVLIDSSGSLLGVAFATKIYNFLAD